MNGPVRLADPRPRPVGATRREGTTEHDALALTAGGAEARIRLGEAVYTLRITRAGKLILTK